MVLVSEAFAGIKQFTFYYTISIHKRWKRDQGCKPIVDHLTGMHMALGTTCNTFPTGLWQEGESLCPKHPNSSSPHTLWPPAQAMPFSRVVCTWKYLVLLTKVKTMHWLKNRSAAFRGAPTTGRKPDMEGWMPIPADRDGLSESEVGPDPFSETSFQKIKHIELLNSEMPIILATKWNVGSRCQGMSVWAGEWARWVDRCVP